MGKYCCFFDPERDFSEKELTDTCPKCNRTYGYILENMPAEIRNNNIKANARNNLRWLLNHTYKIYL